MTKREYKICKNCIMDTSDPDIEFDSDGICNHCLSFEVEKEKRLFNENDRGEQLNNLIKKIKKAGKNKEYDCVIGVSGGVDSTYVAYLIKKLGLRPLAIHFDNGWNSELAVSNIEKTLNKLDIDLFTYVINWEEFKDLQISFLKASTPDGEIPSDHAINALLWKQAVKYNIKYIITGMNYATESMAVPKWSYGHSDWKYIRDVHKKFGTVKLKTYLHFSLWDLFNYNFIKGIRNVSILNYIDYNKEEVMNILQDELGWVYYGGKHYESIYTRFFQSYILPVKFNIDKRRGHLSDLIKVGQITREEALKEIENPICSESLQKEDKLFVLKKLGLTNSAFDEIINTEPKTFEYYKNNYNLIKKVKRVVNFLRLKKIYPK